MYLTVIVTFNICLVCNSILGFPLGSHISNEDGGNEKYSDGGILLDGRIRHVTQQGMFMRQGMSKMLNTKVSNDDVVEALLGKNVNQLDDVDDEDDDDDDDGILWPDGVIYYEIEKSFLPESRKLLSKVMRQFETRTCIRFKERTEERDYVLFTSEKNACSSSIGRVGGDQTIHLGKGCISQGRFEHEIMHTLGFIHEHSRPDRDKYISINFKNIKKKYLDDFEKYKRDDEIDYLQEEFNFNSVMLYRNRAFSKNGKDTIIAKGEPGLKFGQRKQFSVGDVRAINKLYKCDKYLKHPNYKGLVKEYHGRKKTKMVTEQHGAKEE